VGWQSDYTQCRFGMPAFAEFRCLIVDQFKGVKVHSKIASSSAGRKARFLRTVKPFAYSHHYSSGSCESAQPVKSCSGLLRY
jgi:hypothetical protein